MQLDRLIIDDSSTYTHDSFGWKPRGECNIIQALGQAHVYPCSSLTKVGTIGTVDGYPPEIVSHEVIDEDGPFEAQKSSQLDRPRIMHPNSVHHCWWNMARIKMD